MAIIYNWTINPLDCYPTASGETDVVFTAHWQFHATSGSAELSESVYRATSIGTQALTYASGSEFIPFEDLTLEIVQGWVTGAMGEAQVNALTASLAQQIANQINPPVVTLQSPWLNTSGSV